MLQSVAVCYTVLQCVAAFCSLFKCVAVVGKCNSDRYESKFVKAQCTVTARGCTRVGAVLRVMNESIYRHECCVYEGEFVKGTMHGHGVMSRMSHVTYESWQHMSHATYESFRAYEYVICISGLRVSSWETRSWSHVSI